jgi:hypothetical protein
LTKAHGPLNHFNNRSTQRVLALDSPQFITFSRLFRITASNLSVVLAICAVIGLPPTDLRGATWETGPGYRRLPLEPVGAGKDGFTLLPPETTGIAFTNLLSETRGLASQILPSGSGVAAGDVDGDGLCDIYFCGLKCGNRLYRNLGNWRFEDITERAGVGCTNLDATGAVLVDIDGDGDLDLIVNSIGGGTHIFFNDGHAKFTEANEVLNPGMGGMSSGLADYDGDGRLDLYIANYRVESIIDQPNIRFSVRNVNGHLAVTSINDKPLTDPEWTNRFRFEIRDNSNGSVKFAKEELGEPDVLYRNLGGGHFEHVPFTGGAFLNENGMPLTQAPFDWGLSVMFRDLNNDGKPDLYICNDFNTPDRIWLNLGGGRFQAIRWESIRQSPLSSMAIDVADINRDGFDDLFVVDMLSRDHRRRLVQRTNLSPEVIPPGAIENRPQYSRNVLQLNRGDGTYAEIAQFCGLEASEWSWTPIFLDVDLDGYEDLLVANGFLRDNMNMDALEATRKVSAGQRPSNASMIQQRRLFPVLNTPKIAFRNLGDLKFAEMGLKWGFNAPVISQGMCLADLDNDGDLDVIANNLNSVASIYRNDSSKPRIAISLKGLTPNTQGIGAKIVVYGGAVPMQSQQIISGGRYLSSDQAQRTFAAGSATNIMSIQVDWPSHRRSLVQNVSANYLYEIDESIATNSPVPQTTPSAKLAEPLFQDVSSRLGHKHREDSFDDFSRQANLPKRLSQLGPGVCWCDLTGTGHDDLVIGSGFGGQMASFLNDGQGRFKPSDLASLKSPGGRSQTTILEMPVLGKGSTLIFGTANYEATVRTNASVLAWDPLAGIATDLLAGLDESVGPLALGDLDGDGNLDLFIGGRVKAGRYPEAVSSWIYRFKDGAFRRDESNSKLLEKVGMVTAAVWSDLDGDGFPELILACEWGPIRVFHNDHGRLFPTNLPLSIASVSNTDEEARATRRQMSAVKPLPTTLTQLTGWWNGLTTADLDGDGKLEIIASNWGDNSRYQCHRAAPLRLYFGDYNEDGTLGLLEAYFEPSMGKYVPERRLDIASQAMPFLRGRFTSAKAYSDSGIDEILGDRLPQSHFVEANWLESTVFMNRGDHFEPRLMPAEAQFAPAFAVVVADFDGDGNEDVFLSQNFFAVEPETSRYDAGRGLYLKGDGRGGLHPVSGAESGITIYGEQRGAAAADFDGDGRVDLVVSQNAAETRLFRNIHGKPGLRVRLKGPPGNPRGIGVQMRLKHGDSLGPVREIHGGSGYWSEDSPVQVLGNFESPAQLWLRWPGGKTFTVDVPIGATEIQVDINGSTSSR